MRQLHVSDEFGPLVKRIDEIAPILRAGAEEGEELGRVTDEVATALRESGAFEVGIPRELGGYEFSPRQLIDAVARISYADASAGWAFMAVQMETGTTAAYLGREAAQDSFPTSRATGTACSRGRGPSSARPPGSKAATASTGTGSSPPGSPWPATSTPPRSARRPARR